MAAREMHSYKFRLMEIDKTLTTALFAIDRGEQIDLREVLMQIGVLCDTRRWIYHDDRPKAHVRRDIRRG